MIMIGAGTGLAPFRGFLQERAVLKAGGVPVATSLLFFGCRTSKDDYLYEDELRRYEADGVVEVDAVFSREGIDNDATSRMRSCSVRMRSGISSRTSEQHLCVRQCQHHGARSPHRAYRGVPDAAEASTDGLNWLAGLRAEGRFLEDIWGG